MYRWQKLAEYTKERREALGLSQREVADKANISVNSYRAIEKGDEVRFTTLDAIDKGLQWAPGSARALLEGGATPQPEPDFELPENVWHIFENSDIIDSEVVDLNGEMSVCVICLVPKGRRILQIADDIRQWSDMKQGMAMKTDPTALPAPPGWTYLVDSVEPHGSGSPPEEGASVSTSGPASPEENRDAINQNTKAINYLYEMLTVHQGLDDVKKRIEIEVARNDAVEARLDEHDTAHEKSDLRQDKSDLRQDELENRADAGDKWHRNHETKAHQE